MYYHRKMHGEKVSKRPDKQYIWQVRQAIASVAISVIALLVVPTFSWLYFRRSLETTTMINRPNALVIGAGDRRAISELELSDVDTSREQKFKDVVFCVYSDFATSYHLQLAHTTNIGFTYTIYKASMDSSEGSETVNYLGQDYYFNSTPLRGKYLNQDKTTGLANDSLHNKTYDKIDGSAGSYDYVQRNAEPLYWKTEVKQELLSKDDIHYYVLRIMWDSSTWNNKETDMIYLMAESLN